MQSLFATVGVVLGLLLAFPMYRIVKGPTVYDRLVGVSTMGTKTVVLLLVMGYIMERPEMYVDLSIGYGLALIVGTLATAKYLEKTDGEAG